MRINQKQRLVIWAMGCLILGFLVYPPWWSAVWESPRQLPKGHFDFSPSAFGIPHKVFQSYGWIFEPNEHEPLTTPWETQFPSIKREEERHRYGVGYGIEYTRWATEVGLVIAVGGGLLWVLKDRTQN